MFNSRSGFYTFVVIMFDLFHFSDQIGYFNQFGCGISAGNNDLGFGWFLCDNINQLLN